MEVSFQVSISSTTQYPPLPLDLQAASPKALELCDHLINTCKRLYMESNLNTTWHLTWLRAIIFKLNTGNSQCQSAHLVHGHTSSLATAVLITCLLRETVKGWLLPVFDLNDHKKQTMCFLRIFRLINQ